VVAAVHGPALGGGCELTLVCDLVITSGLTFGQPEIKLESFAPGGASPATDDRSAPGQRALLTGRVVDAAGQPDSAGNQVVDELRGTDVDELVAALRA
jgi:enoyl-CoA hydratase/carnithine racemase